MTAWQQWLERPDKSRVRNVFFQVHFWMGAAAGAYILLMSVSGSLIVFRNELSGNSFVEWVVRLHENLLAGTTGRFVNGIGAVCLTLLCLTGGVIWWPGTKHWRRSLTVDWSAHFARINWDLHSALGFWCFIFVVVWGISAIYFSFPQAFNTLFVLDPADRFTDQACSGSHSYTLVASAGSPRPFGWFWDSYPGSSRSPGYSSAAGE
jgi:uncharacterized iron-regulated membrane protein